MNTKEEIIEYLEKKYDKIYKEYTMVSEQCYNFKEKSAKEKLMRQILKDIR